MVVLGIILLVVAAALVVLLASAGTSPDVVLDLIGGQRLTTNPAWIFVAGVVTLALAELGLLLIRRGTRRAVTRRREMRDLRRAAEQSARDTGRRPDEHEAPRQDGEEGRGAPDRTLVRDVGELREGNASDRSPENSADPEASRHGLSGDPRPGEHRH